MKKNYAPTASLVSAALLSMCTTSGAAGLDESEFNSMRQLGNTPSAGDHWTDRIQMGGFAAAGAISAGPAINDYRRKNFVVHEINTFIKATPAQDVSAMIEIYPFLFQPSTFQSTATAAGAPSGFISMLGEGYLQLKNLATWGTSGSITMKLGRFDIPYGTDYVRQDSVDNPLITKSVAWLWGWDEGVQLNIKSGNSGAAVAVTDGAVSRNTDDTGAKDYTLKLWTELFGSLQLAGSAHWMGPTSSHAMYQGAGLLNYANIFGGSKIGYNSGSMYELGGSHQWSSLTTHFNVGKMYFNAENNTIKRQATYYSIEPNFKWTDKTYFAVRYSAMGTFADGVGININDSLSGNLGTSAKSLKRIALGAGYKLNPATTLKAEVMKDEMAVTTGTKAPDNRRLNFGLQVAMKF